MKSFGWDGEGKGKLWRYNQHYFDDLNARGAWSRKTWHEALLMDWVAQNPAGHGSGWEPYPTSLRIVNWIKWSLAGNHLPPDCIDNLAVQARWLMKRLEFHLLGNHLFANAKALVFVGAFFEGVESGKWLAKGMQILSCEVPEQILDDGGHFERSTMYHALALEDMLDLLNLSQLYSKPFCRYGDQIREWRKKIPAMIDWFKAMSHPDGEIGFFNDSAFEIAPAGGEIKDYSSKLGFNLRSEKESCSWMKQSGYVRLATENAVALLDMAPVGPNYLPAHAHADTLSFELSVFGQRLLVNSGTSCYGTSNERLRQRGTPAHNTVTLNEENSSDVWGGFRVARRARPINLEVDLLGRIKRAQAGHDGYERLDGKPIHNRRWEMEEDNLTVIDTVSSKKVYSYARFHFHPNLTIEVLDKTSQSEGLILLPSGKQVYWTISKGEGRLTDSTWHPVFGTSLLNKVLSVKLDDSQSKVQFFWAT